MQLDRDLTKRKKILNQIPYGLYIITSRSGNESNAFSGSWLSQSSFKPPMIMIASQKDSKSTKLMLKSGFFAVNFVDKSQSAMIKFFFKPAHKVEKLKEYKSNPSKISGCPIFEEVLAYLDCKIVHKFIHGDHTVIVGEIVDAEVFREGKSLLISDTKWSYSG